MDDELTRKPEAHFFVGSKAVWYDIADDLPQHDAYPAEFDAEPQDRPTRLPSTQGAIGGSCLCGEVAFEFDETMDRMGFCHCSRCRKSRSSAHSAQTFVAPDAFRWTSGEDRVRQFKLPESDFFFTSFCDICGSPMPMEFPERGVVMVPMGAVDQDPIARPQAHIYVGSKAPWVDSADDLLQFEAMPPV